MKKDMKRASVNRQSGFSFVELMVAVSILTTVALAAAGVATLMSRANDYSDRKNEQQSLAAFILNNLSHSESCSAAMGPNSGLTQQVDDTAIRLSGAAGGGWPVQMVLKNVTGTVGNGFVFPLRKLKIRSLRFADAVQTIGGPSPTYLASLYLGTDVVGGSSQKEILVGSLVIATDAAHNVTSCQSMSNASYQQTCHDMNCNYDTSVTPATCKCLRTQVVCAAPGYVPVAFSADGLPDCRPIGGDIQCPAGEFLIGVGIDWYKCGPIPTSTPPAVVCTGGASTTVTANAASPSGCYCSATQTWNGASCVLSSPLVNGACKASGGYVNSAAVNSFGLCSAGSSAPASVSGSGPWSWTCNGSGGGTNASCSATVSSGPVNGLCKASGPYADAAAVNSFGLCSTGSASPSSVSGSGPWSWNCNGSGGGTDASCSATVSAGPPSCYVNCSRPAGGEGPLSDYCASTPVYSDVNSCPGHIFRVDWTVDPSNSTSTQGCLSHACTASTTGSCTPAVVASYSFVPNQLAAFMYINGSHTSAYGPTQSWGSGMISYTGSVTFTDGTVVAGSGSCNFGPMGCSLTLNASSGGYSFSYPLTLFNDSGSYAAPNCAAVTATSP